MGNFILYVFTFLKNVKFVRLGTIGMFTLIDVDVVSSQKLLQPSQYLTYYLHTCIIWLFYVQYHTVPTCYLMKK